MKKLLAAAAVLVLLFAGVWYMGQKPPPEVSLHTLSRGTVERTVSNTRAGTVEACRRSKLSMPIGGRVDELMVDEGDIVESGEILLSLWNRDRKAMTAQAKAQQLATQNRAEQVCVEAENAKRESKRLDALVAKQLTSTERAEIGRTRAEASAFSCQAARDEREVAAANLEMNEALLEETYLRAPFKGIVAEINGEIGEYVTPSPPGVATPPAVDLIDYSCLYVTAPIDEVDAGELHNELPARITLDAFRGEVFPGGLSRIAPYILDFEKQALTVEIDVTFAEESVRERLLVGYSADIDIILETRENVLRLPSEAIMEGDKVYRYSDSGGSIELVEVEAGIRNWNFTEVLGGLAEGDQVVMSLDIPELEDGLEVIAADD